MSFPNTNHSFQNGIGRQSPADTVLSGLAPLPPRMHQFGSHSHERHSVEEDRRNVRTRTPSSHILYRLAGFDDPQVDQRRNVQVIGNMDDSVGTATRIRLTRLHASARRHAPRQTAPCLPEYRPDEIRQWRSYPAGGTPTRPLPTGHCVKRHTIKSKITSIARRQGSKSSLQ